MARRVSGKSSRKTKKPDLLGLLRKLHRFEESVMRTFHRVVLGWVSTKNFVMGRPWKTLDTRQQLQLHEAEFYRTHHKLERLVRIPLGHRASERSKSKIRPYGATHLLY